MAKNGVIIVAAGKGERMNLAQPKQFISIAGLPVIVHSIYAFLAFDPQIRIVLVLGEGHYRQWDQLKKMHFPNTKITTTTGGTTRFESVQNGLKVIVDTQWVAVHDAVRPCVDVETIGRTFESARQYGSGIPVVPLKDSIRQIADGSSVAEDRNKYVIVQTPQTFDVSLLVKSYLQNEQSHFTDDATVYESDGNRVHLVSGTYQNIKITTAEDIGLAEQFLEKK